MTSTFTTTRAVAPSRFAMVGLLACAIPLLAGCVGGGDADPAAPSASPAEAAPLADDAAIDNATRNLLSDFMPEVEGLERLDDFTPRATAGEIFGSAVDEVEPAACLPVYRGISLATEADRGSAANDAVQPHPPYLPGGEFLEGGGVEQLVAVTTRIFGDPEMAAATAADMLDAECEGYATRSEWATGAHASEDTVSTISEVTLAGLESPTVRVDFSGGTSTGYDAAGEVVGEDSRGPWHDYVHVDGAYGIAVSVLGMPDPDAVAAQVIADFLAHMDQA